MLPLPLTVSGLKNPGEYLQTSASVCDISSHIVEDSFNFTVGTSGPANINRSLGP
jgi:hypothetical protein